MRITNNTLSEGIVRQIQHLSETQSKLQTQVATGQKIFQAEDDPAAVGRVLGLESEQRQVAQFTSNADYALELSQATYSTLQEIKKVSDRATEIGTLAGGIISPESSRAYAAEVNQLIGQTLELSNTKFRNDSLFAGTAVDATPFAATRDAQGNVTAVSYVGNDDQAPIRLSNNASVTPGSPGTMNRGLGNFLKHLVDLRDSLSSGNLTKLADIQTGLVASEDGLVSAIADHGGIQTRIQASRAQLQQRGDSLEALVSTETDADLPSTIVRLNQNQTAYQAALQSAANIMRISLLDYIK